MKVVQLLLLPILQHDREGAVSAELYINAYHEIHHVIHLQLNPVIINVRSNKFQYDVTFRILRIRSRDERSLEHRPWRHVLRAVLDHLPPGLRLRQVLAVVRKAVLRDLRGIEVALALPLRRHGHALPGADALDALPHLHVVVLEVHEDAGRVVLDLGAVDAAVAVRHSEAIEAVVAGEAAVDLEVFAEKRKGQEDLRRFRY